MMSLIASLTKSFVFLTLVKIEVFALFIGGIIALLILIPVIKALKWEMRRLPVIDACLEALRVAAERGTPLVMGTGHIEIRVAAAASSVVEKTWFPSMLRLLRYLCQQGAKLNTRVISCSNQPIMSLMQMDFQQQGYVLGGRPDLYQIDNVRYFPDYTSYGVGVVETIHSVKPAAGIHLSFTVWGHNAVIYEAFARHNAYLVAGELYDNDNAPAVIASDYVSFGEENIAIGPYLGEDPLERHLVVGEDFIKWFMMLGVIVMGILKVVMV